MSKPRTDASAAPRAAIRDLLGKGVIAYHPDFAAIGGGVCAGVLLSQLFYWHDRGRDPAGWIYKTRAEWKRETGLSRSQQETARRQLRERGILEERIGGLPARLYYRLDTARVIELLTEHAAGGAWASQAQVREGSAAVGEDSDGQEEMGGAGVPDSRRQAGGVAADKQEEKPPSAWQESRHQAGRNTAHQPAGFPHASRRDSGQHAETTREHSKQEGPEKTAAAARAVGAAGTGGSSDILCSIHHVPMSLRHKDGDAWYSHRLPDGTWCRGAIRDPPDGRCDPSSIEFRREYLAWAAPVRGRNRGRDPGSMKRKV